MCISTETEYRDYSSERGAIPVQDLDGRIDTWDPVDAIELRYALETPFTLFMLDGMGLLSYELHQAVLTAIYRERLDEFYGTPSAL